jgi:hypothetical protein
VLLCSFHKLKAGHRELGTPAYCPRKRQIVGRQVLTPPEAELISLEDVLHEPKQQAGTTGWRDQITQKERQEWLHELMLAVDRPPRQSIGKLKRVNDPRTANVRTRHLN